MGDVMGDGMMGWLGAVLCAVRKDCEGWAHSSTQHTAQNTAHNQPKLSPNVTSWEKIWTEVTDTRPKCSSYSRFKLPMHFSQHIIQVAVYLPVHGWNHFNFWLLTCWASLLKQIWLKLFCQRPNYVLSGLILPVAHLIYWKLGCNIVKKSWNRG